ncbi:MAG: hypothetical protein QOJ68_3923 [Blastococcus sp.]|nr:hypothetical protein [Blastococcus sp.]
MELRDRVLVGADDREGLVDEDVMRPVDADVVDLVLAIAQLHDMVDDAPRVGDQRSLPAAGEERVTLFARPRSAEGLTAVGKPDLRS